MKTYLVDTNVILRYLLNDIPDQAEKARRIFNRARSLKARVKILPIILVEVVYHLIHTYKIPRNEVADTLQIFISPKWIKIENKDAILEVLELFKNSKVDMVDLMLFTIAKHKGYEIVSFDKDFKRLRRSIKRKS